MLLPLQKEQKQSQTRWECSLKFVVLQDVALPQPCEWYCTEKPVAVLNWFSSLRTITFLDVVSQLALTFFAGTHSGSSSDQFVTCTQKPGGMKTFLCELR